MFFIQLYLFCVLGILISIILPILRESLPQPKGGIAGVGSTLARFISKGKPYIKIGIFSLIAGILIVAYVGDTLKDWRTALLFGYAWDSTLQKLKGTGM